MNELLPCMMCGNEVSPQAAFCPKCGQPAPSPLPKTEPPPPGGISNMSGMRMREMMAIIDNNLEILRETSIHGSGEMKQLATALLRARSASNPKL